jgi:hypothetical protein
VLKTRVKDAGADDPAMGAFPQLNGMTLVERLHRGEYELILSDFNSMAKVIYDLWSRLVKLNAACLSTIIRAEKGRYKVRLN